jgi:hypothetical protein
MKLFREVAECDTTRHDTARPFIPDGRTMLRFDMPQDTAQLALPYAKIVDGTSDKKKNAFHSVTVHFTYYYHSNTHCSL